MADKSTQARPSQNAPTNTSSSAGFAIEILAQNSTTASNSHDLPALLGLDTLSLSLPRTNPKAGSTSLISRIRIQGIHADCVHLLFSSPALDTGIRSGFCIHVPPTASDINLRLRWNYDTEELEPCREDHQSLEKQASGASFKTFDYGELLRMKSGDAPAQDGWSSLTRFITPAELDRLTPLGRTGVDGIQLWPVSTLSTSPTDTDVAASPAQQADIQFTPITLKNTFPPSSIGRDRTKHSLDKSWYLSSILPEPAPSGSIYGSTLLAEFAFSFLLASTLGSNSASQHWKDILRVSLRCTSAVTASSTHTFFVALLQLLGVQLRNLDIFPSTDRHENPQHSEQKQSSNTPGTQTASAPFESEDDLAALYELLLTFGRKNLSESALPEADPESDSPRRAVRTAYLSLARLTSLAATDATAPSWDLESALSYASANDEDDKQQRRLQRRILRGMEGFGYGAGLGYADDEGGLADVGEGEPGEEDEDDAPVVLDLDGLLESAKDGGEDEDDEQRHQNTDRIEDEVLDEEEDDNEELEDLRY